MSSNKAGTRYNLRSKEHEATAPLPSHSKEQVINGSRRKRASSSTTTLVSTSWAGASSSSSKSATSEDKTKKNKSESDGEPTEVENARKVIMEYSVDPYDYSHDELLYLSIEIFKYYHLLEIFEFSENDTCNFLTAVKEMYRNNNDFHNFRHAWGVMHMCFQILTHGADQHLDSFDILAVLVAAICHDVGHPGNNNAFELAINSDVSKKYAQPNEGCVLEKFHASETQSLLSKKPTRKNSNILFVLSEEEKRKFFHQVKFIILGTDMAKHSALVEEAKELIDSIVINHPPVASATDTVYGIPLVSSSSSTNSSLSNSLLDSPSSTSSKMKSKHPHLREVVEKQFHNPTVLLEPEIRLALTRIIVHTADIGAQTQQLRIATKWAERVYNEFRSQAEKERALGIVTSPFIHQLSEDYMIYTSQSSFIQDIVFPIWNAVFKLLPDLRFAVEQLQANKNHYHEHGESLKAKKLNNTVESGEATSSEAVEVDVRSQKRQKKQK